MGSRLGRVCLGHRRPVRVTRLSVVSAVVALASVVPVRALEAATTAGLWHMDETAGSIAHDSSGNQNDGQLQNVSFVSGGFGFDGKNSRVLVPDDATLDPGSQNITISVAVRFTHRPTQSVHDYDIVRKGAMGTFYKIEIALSGRARCQFHGTAGAQGIVFGPDLSDGQWHTITCTKSAATISGSVDSSSASRAANIGSISNGTALSFGGKARGTQDLYLGDMADVKIVIG
jgi:hypothetical protein